MRIVIAEDSAVVRAGLVEILADRGHQVVAAVGDAEALLAAVEEHQPDVTVVDVRMPPGFTDEGLRAAIAIRRDHPGIGVLVFSQYIETRHAADLIGGLLVTPLLEAPIRDRGERFQADLALRADGTVYVLSSPGIIFRFSAEGAFEPRSVQPGQWTFRVLALRCSLRRMNSNRTGCFLLAGGCNTNVGIRERF